MVKKLINFNLNKENIGLIGVNTRINLGTALLKSFKTKSILE